MSVCPICNKRVKRKNRTKRKGIWIHKKCPEKEETNVKKNRSAKT